MTPDEWTEYRRRLELRDGRRREIEGRLGWGALPDRERCRLDDDEERGREPGEFVIRPGPKPGFTRRRHDRRYRAVQQS